jgi:hypothetical protein
LYDELLSQAERDRDTAIQLAEERQQKIIELEMKDSENE